MLPEGAVLLQYTVNHWEELLDVIRTVNSVSCKNKNDKGNFFVFSYPQGR